MRQIDFNAAVKCARAQGGRRSGVISARSLGRRLTPPGARPLTAKETATRPSIAKAASRERRRQITDRVAGE